MRETAIVLVGLSVLLSLWFVSDYGLPWRSANPPMAWLWSMLGIAGALFDTLLLLALLRVPVPWILAIVALLLQDAALAWRQVVLRRARRADQDGRGDDA